MKYFYIEKGKIIYLPIDNYKNFPEVYYSIDETPIWGNVEGKVRQTGEIDYIRICLLFRDNTIPIGQYELKGKPLTDQLITSMILNKLQILGRVFDKAENQYIRLIEDTPTEFDLEL